MVFSFPSELLYFNPHFRKGSDLISSFLTGVPVNFNPHFRKGSDRISLNIECRPSDFNPHFRKGSDWFPACTTYIYIYFNPHFRKGSDRNGRSDYQIRRISIHTSAREVTADPQHSWKL